MFRHVISILFLSFICFVNASETKKIAYIVSDTKIPFWNIMTKGITDNAFKLGYKVDVYGSNNDAKTELEFTVKAIREKVVAIIVSPTSSSACVTILKLAKSANIPVVISDIGTDNGDYLSYVSSNNKEGAYELGKILAKKMVSLGFKNGKVGIIAIPQKRINGQERTTGFMQALNEYNIKSADIKQQVTFSYQETYDYSKELIVKYPDLKAIWLQGSHKYQGALDAIRDTGKQGNIFLICFDAEPIFLELIPKGILVGAAMQQPYLMGQKAVEMVNKHISGIKVEKNLQLPILAISKDNIKENLPVIKKNVLGIVK